MGHEGALGGGKGEGEGEGGRGLGLQGALCATTLNRGVELVGEGGSVGTLEGHLAATALGGTTTQTTMAGRRALHPGHLTDGDTRQRPLVVLEVLTNQLPLAAHLCLAVGSSVAGRAVARGLSVFSQSALPLATFLPPTGLEVKWRLAEAT